MLYSLGRHPAFKVVAAAQPEVAALQQFGEDYDARVFASVGEMCASGAVDAVYIATPTELHLEHALLAADAGLHALLEKPMAHTLEAAIEVVEAFERAGTSLVVGHSHSFDVPIQAMRSIVESGEVGAVRMAHNWTFTDWMFRPRRPDELRPDRGGGVTLRQGAHQMDVLRYLAGGRASQVRAGVGDWDPERPGQGAHACFVSFEDGAFATAVYSGYDHLLTSELTGVEESGAGHDSVGGSRRRTWREGLGTSQESRLKAEAAYPGYAGRFGPQAHQPSFGLTVLSCESGEIRQTPDGLRVYGSDGVRDVSLRRDITGRDLVAIEWASAIRGCAVQHDGRWGVANLEASVAILESARSGTEVPLRHQVALRPSDLESSLLFDDMPRAEI
jgi:phthalate 4,5-cis-dihydrodiol dehydrogenase